MTDLEDLTDEQLDDLVSTLSAFAAWIEVCGERPDDAPFDAYAQALLASPDHQEAAVDFISTAQAVREARKPRLYVAPDERE